MSLVIGCCDFPPGLWHSCSKSDYKTVIRGPLRWTEPGDCSLRYQRFEGSADALHTRVILLGPSASPLDSGDDLCCQWMTGNRPSFGHFIPFQNAAWFVWLSQEARCGVS